VYGLISDAEASAATQAGIAGRGIGGVAAAIIEASTGAAAQGLADACGNKVSEAEAGASNAFIDAATLEPDVVFTATISSTSNS